MPYAKTISKIARPIGPILILNIIQLDVTTSQEMKLIVSDYEEIGSDVANLPTNMPY